MVHPEEPAVTRHCAAHGHALIGGEGLGEQALRPGAHRRGQIRVRQVRGILLPRLGGAAQLALIQFTPVHEQVNTRKEHLKRQNLLGGGTIGDAGAHAEALVLAVELFKSLTQQSEVGICGALQNLRGVVAGVRRVSPEASGCGSISYAHGGLSDLV